MGTETDKSAEEKTGEVKPVVTKDAAAEPSGHFTGITSCPSCGSHLVIRGLSWGGSGVPPVAPGPTPDPPFPLGPAF